MTRVRAPLTEKQERILVQCQLMGLTTRDMTQISNRLVLLERERNFIKDVEMVMQNIRDYKIDKVKHVYEIVDGAGNVYTCKKSQKASYYSESFDVKVNRTDGTIKTHKNQLVYTDSSGEVAKHCPEKNKRLFRLCKSIKTGRWI